MKKNLSTVRKIVLDPFCYRQFDKTKTSVFINYDQEELAEKINQFYLDNKLLFDGYAPFCKHIFIENFTDMTPSAVEITEENEGFIKTCYEARTEKELPVLKRYIPLEKVKNNLKPAKFLDIILYSKEQIQKENLAMGNVDPNVEIDYQYGIISVKPQDVDWELPMDPITMMRNALGVEHGGSGVELERNKYMNSVAFWSKYVLLK
jgi:hypothetical protein